MQVPYSEFDTDNETVRHPRKSGRETKLRELKLTTKRQAEKIIDLEEKNMINTIVVHQYDSIFKKYEEKFKTYDEFFVIYRLVIAQTIKEKKKAIDTIDKYKEKEKQWHIFRNAFKKISERKDALYQQKINILRATNAFFKVTAYIVFTGISMIAAYKNL